MADSSRDFKEQAASLQAKLVEMRRELHRHPELSHEEYETTARIRAWLREAGVATIPLGLPTGVLAEVKGDRPGPVILLRADIDALPVKEETGLPYASENEGKMHACGHDFHTASMIGAAILLNQNAHLLQGTVRILFQPAEESAAGARAVIETGALEGVRAVFGMHNKPDLPVGTVGVKAGPLMASVDRFKILVSGKGGHAGIPETAADPVVATGAIVGALQTLVSRNVSPHHSAVVSVCNMHAGSTWNVIPDSGVLEGTVRTFEPEARAVIPQRMRQIAEWVAAGYGVKAELVWTPLLPAVINDKKMAQLMRRAAERQGLRVVEAEPVMGGEDFALYLERWPGCFIWMGTDGTEGWHHPKFTVNEEALSVSAAYFAEVAAEALRVIRA